MFGQFRQKNNEFFALAFGLPWIKTFILVCMAEIPVTFDAFRWPARILGDKMCSFAVMSFWFYFLSFLSTSPNKEKLSKELATERGEDWENMELGKAK